MTKHFLNNFITIYAHKGPHAIPNVGFCLGTLFHKALEFELSYQKDYYQYFHLGIGWTTKTDHAGPSIEFGLFGLEIGLRLYDSRHWYYKANRWYEPGEESRLLEERKAKGLPNENIEYGDVNLLDEE